MRLLLCALSIAWLTTLPAGASAHSEQRLPDGETVRWHRRAVTFVVDPSLYDRDSLPDPERVIRGAAAAWRGIGYVPRFDVRAGSLGAPGYDPRRGDNTSGVALYRRNFPQRLDRAVLALTLLTRNSVTGEIVDADVIVDAERNRFAQIAGSSLSGIPGAPNDYQNVFTHEFGHVLGLVEDPEHPDSTMFPSSQPGEVSKRKLAEVDRESAAHAYSTPYLIAGCGSSLNPRAPGGRALAAVALALMGYAAFRKRGVRMTALAVGVVMLALAAPGPRTHTSARGLVLRAETRPEGTMLVTHALVQTSDGTVTVVRPGGRFGGLEQQVLDAPSGDALRVGATVDLPELR